MSEFDWIPPARPAATSALFVLLTALAGFYLVGPAIGFLLAIPFIDGSMTDLAAKIIDPLNHPEVKVPFFIIQGSATFFGLIVGPAFYWYSAEKQNVFNLVRHRTTPVLIFLVVGILVVVFMAPNSVIIDLNAHFSFPDFLKDFETWARDRENYAERLTQFLTTFGSTGEFLFAFFVVAILPGIAEELVFRGMLQPQLHKATQNAHAAIWISAFLFSSMHLQFFGFVPRVLLGALFGYLYYWSGNLLIPIFAHFVNNGFSVIMLYLQQLGKINVDVDSTDAAPWPVVISGTIITFGLLFLLKKYFDRNHAELRAQ